MFFRLLWESFVRQRRRKALAGLAIFLGTTAVTAMLALATTIGDRIHRELAVYGANIVVYPKADLLDVKIGGLDVKPVTGGVYLHESDLAKLKTIFWANNITGISPELPLEIHLTQTSASPAIPAIGVWFAHPLGNNGLTTGAVPLHPWWKIEGAWPVSDSQFVVGKTLAETLHLHVGDHIGVGEDTPLLLSGIVTTGDDTDSKALLPLAVAQQLSGLSGQIARVDVSAKTRPEDAFARVDPDSLPAKTREIWYCRPYANSIAYQIREAIPGAQAEQIRRVEQSEGTVLARISGLMWLLSAAALLAAGFAVSAAMATAVLERRREIGLMRSLGASKAGIAGLFYSETGLLAVIAGTGGYVGGSALAFWLGARIFPGDGTPQLFLPVLFPVVIAMALIVAVAGSTPSIRAALNADPSDTLRGDQ